MILVGINSPALVTQILVHLSEADGMLPLVLKFRIMSPGKGTKTPGEISVFPRSQPIL